MEIEVKGGSIDLGELVVSNLRRAFPGLYVYLEAMSMAKYGVGIRELVRTDLVKFLEIVNGHFSSEMVTVKVIKILFKPLLEGKDELILKAVRGECEELINYLKSAIRTLRC